MMGSVRYMSERKGASIGEAPRKRAREMHPSNAIASQVKAPNAQASIAFSLNKNMRPLRKNAQARPNGIGAAPGIPKLTPLMEGHPALMKDFANPEVQTISPGVGIQKNGIAA